MQIARIRQPRSPRWEGRARVGRFITRFGVVSRERGDLDLGIIDVHLADDGPLVVGISRAPYVEQRPDFVNVDIGGTMANEVEKD